MQGHVQQLNLFPEGDIKLGEDIIVYQTRGGEVISVKVNDLRKFRYFGCRAPLEKRRLKKPIRGANFILVRG